VSGSIFNHLEVVTRSGSLSAIVAAEEHEGKLFTFGKNRSSD
jgi:hypothetical protein